MRSIIILLCLLLLISTPHHGAAYTPLTDSKDTTSVLDSTDTTNDDALFSDTTVISPPPDSDGDGAADDLDPCPFDFYDVCTTLPDSDQDGLMNEDDPCPYDALDTCKQPAPNTTSSTPLPLSSTTPPPSTTNQPTITSATTTNITTKQLSTTNRTTTTNATTTTRPLTTTKQPTTTSRTSTTGTQQPITTKQPSTTSRTLTTIPTTTSTTPPPAEDDTTSDIMPEAADKPLLLPETIDETTDEGLEQAEEPDSVGERLLSRVTEQREPTPFDETEGGIFSEETPEQFNEEETPQLAEEPAALAEEEVTAADIEEEAVQLEEFRRTLKTLTEEVREDQVVRTVTTLNNEEIEDGEVMELEGQFITYLVDEEGTISKAVTTAEGEVVKEAEDELIIFDEEQMMTLEDIPPETKEEVQFKLTDNSVKPTVAVKLLESVAKNTTVEKKAQKFVFQLYKNCSSWLVRSVDSPKRVITEGYEFAVMSTIITDYYKFTVITIDANEFKEIVKNVCVVKAGDESKIEEFMSYAQRQLEDETKAKLKEITMEKTSSDLLPKDELEAHLKATVATTMAQISPYQAFITPNAPDIRALVAGKTTEQLYTLVASYPWVSDKTLHGKAEMWLYPVQFIKDTPAMETNPFPGKAASDCSEHANMLVSLLRAGGISSEDVRVALGEVNFTGQLGGHAWVEVRINGIWQALDPSTGPFYDDALKKTVKRSPLPYNYWRYHDYPVNEVWTYYNDQFYWDSGKSNAPVSWNLPASTALRQDIERMMVEAKTSFKLTDWPFETSSMLIFLVALVFAITIARRLLRRQSTDTFKY